MRRSVPIRWRVLAEQCSRWGIAFFSIDAFARGGRRAISEPRFAANDNRFGPEGA